MPLTQRIALVYDASAAEGDEASRDVFDQMDAIEPVLAGDGATTLRIGATLDLARLKTELITFRPDIVFNLAESVGGSDRLQVLVPLLLEELRIPFTGCASGAMLLSNDKFVSKQLLAAHGLPVPACIRLVDGKAALWPEPLRHSGQKRGDWLVKASAAHASLHLDDNSVLRNAAPEQVADKIRSEQNAHGLDFFAEQFIDGREFNISLLGCGNGDADVLPPAEIDFSRLPAGSEKIVGYAAKWTEASAEYAGTVRSFDFPARDAALLAALAVFSRQTWRVLNLSGYARVDYRVAADDTPYILEINSNPCITPGAGFPAAAERAGLSYSQLIRRVLSLA